MSLSRTSLIDPAFSTDKNASLGLTKREYFAAIALQGLLAGGGARFDSKINAESAVKLADALIDQLNKEA